MDWGNFVYIDNNYNNYSNFIKDEYDDQIIKNYDYNNLLYKKYLDENMNTLDELEYLYDNNPYQYHYSLFERNEYMFINIIYACIYNSWIFKRLSCIFEKKTRVY